MLASLTDEKRTDLLGAHDVVVCRCRLLGARIAVKVERPLNVHDHHLVGSERSGSKNQWSRQASRLLEQTQPSIGCSIKEEV